MEEKGGGRGVSVRGKLISGSQAAGCLVVFQGPPTSPDIFRALQRTQSEDTVSSTIPLPPSNYTVYGYDLEKNGLPNTLPAVILDNPVPTNALCKYTEKGYIHFDLVSVYTDTTATK